MEPSPRRAGGEHGISTEFFVTWANDDAPALDDPSAPTSPGAAPPRSPFGVSDALNARLAIARLDDEQFCALDVDALVFDNNEALGDRSGLAGTAFRLGGPRLASAAASVEHVCTGGSALLPGGALVAGSAVLSVGPRWAQKYEGAAEYALHTCYRSALDLLREHGLRTAAIAPLHAESKGCPTGPCARVALRTARRFLERHAESIDLLLLLAPSDAAYHAYAAAAPLFFPRSDAEGAAAVGALKPLGSALAAELKYDDFGAPRAAAERLVRVSAFPFNVSAAEDDEEVYGEERPHYLAELSPAFIEVAPSPDEQRRASRASTPGGGGATGAPASVASATPATPLPNGGGTSGEAGGGGAIKASSPASGEAASADLYSRLLRAARRADLRAVSEERIAYLSGTDRSGYPALVVVGRRLHRLRAAGAAGETQVLLHLVRLTEAIATSPFVVVFLATAMPDDCGPTFEFLRDGLATLPSAVRANMRMLYLVHPTLRMRVAFLLKAIFLWGRVSFVGELAELRRDFAEGELVVPDVVTTHDEAARERNWDAPRRGGTRAGPAESHRGSRPAPAPPLRGYT